MSEMQPGLAISAVEFNLGDWVTRYDSAFPGRVVGVHPSIDQVDVEYPTGVEREHPEELIVLPVFHDSMGATRHNVLLLSRINQNLRSRVANLHRPKLTDEQRLHALGMAYVNSIGVRRSKIAMEISGNFSQKDWNAFLKHYDRVDKIAKKNSALTDSPVPAEATTHYVQNDLPPGTNLRVLKPYARRTYFMRDGRKLKVVVNKFVKKFQLLLNSRVLHESTDFMEVDNQFKKIVKKDKGFLD